MTKLTITEALAEIKTIGKRVVKKREFVMNFLYRQDVLRDPHQKEGGSLEVIKRELQGIDDLEERKVTLRRAIQEANTATFVEVAGASRSIADWLVWRREVAPQRQTFLARMSNQLASMRREAMNKGFGVTADKAQSPNDIIVNVNEASLAIQIEGLEEGLGRLDGLLSLKNATTTIDV